MWTLADLVSLFIYLFDFVEMTYSFYLLEHLKVIPVANNI